MQKNKRQLRAMPLHALLDHLEVTYLEWRFSDSETALEGRTRAYFQRVAEEVDRRRRRLLVGSCTCQTCMELRASW